MNHRRPTDGDPSDDISYEDFDDDFVWQDPDDDLDVIDLDALDDEINASPSGAPSADEDSGEPDDSSADDSESGAIKLPPPSAPRPSKPRVPRPVSTPRPPLRDSKRKPLVPSPEPGESGKSEKPTPDAAAPEPDMAEALTQPNGETIPEPTPEAANEPAARRTADADEQAAATDQAEEPVEAPAEEEKPSQQPDTDTVETPGIKPPAPVTRQAAQAAPETVTTPAPGTPAAPAVKPSEEPSPEAATETATEAAAAITAEDTGVETEPEPPPPDWVYHILIALPDELAAQVLELRAAGEVNDMPPPGIALAGSFRTEHLLDVQSQLARWTRNHLPLQIEITGVLAEVVGQHQYVAAWLLQPEEDLHEAQHALRRALAPMIQPLPDARMAFHVHLTISDHVPPRRYPHLIGRMQRDFEPYVWHATDLILVRKDADADDGTWEIANRYD